MFCDKCLERMFHPGNQKFTMFFMFSHCSFLLSSPVSHPVYLLYFPVLPPKNKMFLTVNSTMFLLKSYFFIKSYFF